MNIVLIRRSSISQIDGINTFIFEFASALMRLGHKVKVVTHTTTMTKEQIADQFGVETSPDIVSIGDGGSEVNSTIGNAYVWFSRGSRAVANLDNDIVVMNGVVPLVKSSPVIAVNHGLRAFDTEFESLAWYQKLGLRILYRMIPDEVICLTEKLRSEVERKLNVNTQRLRVIPLPYNLSRHTYVPLEKREKIILHVGTRRVKNLTTTVQGFNLAAKLLNDVKLQIIGPEDPSVEEALSLLNDHAKGRVEYLGPFTRNKLLKLYPKVRAVVMPSTYEGSPYATIESLASGTPIICSDVVPEEMVSDGYNGFRINPFDYLAIGEKICRLIADDDSWVRYSRNALDTAQRYEPTRVANQYLEVGRGLINV